MARNSDLLLGIDIGTTSVKSVLVDLQGTVRAEAAQEYPTHYPHPGWAEQDPEDWWRAVCATVPRLFATGHDPQAVAAIGVSCQAPSMVAVDRSGAPLHPAMIWMDRRSEPQCAWLHEQVGAEAIRQINGGRIDPYYMAPKLLWYQQHALEAYQATWQVLQANGYIVHKLCGACSMDLSHGPITLCFDSAANRWSDQLLDQMGLDAAKLPPVVPCSQVVGQVSRAAADACGLSPSIPVIAGMTDGTAAAIAAGLVDVGDAVEMTGQSTVLLICNDAPYLGDELIPLGHAVPGRTLVVGALVASGGSLRWFRDQLGEPERAEAARRWVDPFDLLGELAAQSPPGANRLVFLPYMFGERSPIWDSHARGVFFGLSLATRKHDLIRAILEGAAFGLRHNVETAARAGFSLTKLACVGGGASSALWNQIKADVLGRPIHLPQSAAGAPLGAAIVAAAGAGLYASVSEAVRQMVRGGPEFQPNLSRAVCYDALYGVYLGLYPALKASFRELAEVPDA